MSWFSSLKFQLFCDPIPSHPTPPHPIPPHPIPPHPIPPHPTCQVFPSHCDENEAHVDAEMKAADGDGSKGLSFDELKK